MRRMDECSSPLLRIWEEDVISLGPFYGVRIWNWNGKMEYGFGTRRPNGRVQRMISYEYCALIYSKLN